MYKTNKIAPLCAFGTISKFHRFYHFRSAFIYLTALLFYPLCVPSLSLISAEISQRRASKRETRTTTFDLGEIAARARFAAKAAAVVSRPSAAEIESIRGQRYFFLSCDL